MSHGSHANLDDRPGPVIDSATSSQSAVPTKARKRHIVSDIYTPGYKLSNYSNKVLVTGTITNADVAHRRLRSRTTCPLKNKQQKEVADIHRPGETWKHERAYKPKCEQKCRNHSRYGEQDEGKQDTRPVYGRCGRVNRVHVNDRSTKLCPPKPICLSGPTIFRWRLLRCLATGFRGRHRRRRSPRYHYGWTCRCLGPIFRERGLAGRSTGRS